MRITATCPAGHQSSIDVRRDGPGEIDGLRGVIDEINGDCDLGDVFIGRCAEVTPLGLCNKPFRAMVEAGTKTPKAARKV